MFIYLTNFDAIFTSPHSYLQKCSCEICKYHQSLYIYKRWSGFPRKFPFTHLCMWITYSKGTARLFIAAALAIIYIGGCKWLKKKLRLMKIRYFEDVICKIIHCIIVFYLKRRWHHCSAAAVHRATASSWTSRQSPDLQCTCEFSNLALIVLTKLWENS